MELNRYSLNSQNGYFSTEKVRSNWIVDITDKVDGKVNIKFAGEIFLIEKNLINKLNSHILM